MTRYDLYFNTTTIMKLALTASVEEVRQCIEKRKVVVVENTKGALVIINYANVNAVRVHQQQTSIARRRTRNKR